MKTKMFKQFLRSKVASGRHCFLKEEAMAALFLTSAQFNVITSRLSKEKLICHLGHGFFVIISDARAHLGFPYIAQFLDKYMKHMHIGYYVSLLSAAEHHGASHQKQQIYQVIVSAHLKNIVFDKVTISFHSLAHRFANASYKKLDTSDGYLNEATVEQTCVDLVTFYEECGYWNNVCTVISGLVRICNTTKLAQLIPYVKTVDLQRLGYILELIATTKTDTIASDLAKLIKLELDKRKVFWTPLTPSEPLEGLKNLKWKLIINDIIEPDL